MSSFAILLAPLRAHTSGDRYEALIKHSTLTSRLGLMLTALSGLSACGGGGGSGSSPEPQVTNCVPVFDRASYDLSIQENTGTTISGISFSDPDADPITLSISGTDSEAFSVANIGGVAFITPPDLRRLLIATRTMSTTSRFPHLTEN